MGYRFTHGPSRLLIAWVRVYQLNLYYKLLIKNVTFKVCLLRLSYLMQLRKKFGNATNLLQCGDSRWMRSLVNCKWESEIRSLSPFLFCIPLSLYASTVKRLFVSRSSFSVSNPPCAHTWNAILRFLCAHNPRIESANICLHGGNFFALRTSLLWLCSLFLNPKACLFHLSHRG